MQNDNVKFKNDLKDRSYRYAINVIKILDELPRDTSCQVMVKQLLRSATSIGANIIEAQASSSRKDFTNFLTYSLKSANESKFWFGLLKETGKVDKDRVNPLIKETEELANILASCIITLKNKIKF